MKKRALRTTTRAGKSSEIRVRTRVHLEPELLAKVDAQVRAEGISRVELVERALREWLARPSRKGRAV